MKSVWPHGFLRRCMMAKWPGFNNTFLVSCLSMTSHDGAVPCIKKILLAPGLGLKASRSMPFYAFFKLQHHGSGFQFSSGPTPMPLCGEGWWLLMKSSLAPRLSMPWHDGKGNGPALIKCFKPSAFL